MRKTIEFDTMVGERAARARMLAGMTVAEVAERFGATRQTFANYESGRTPMPACVVRGLSDIYGVSVSWLVGADDQLWCKGRRNGRAYEVRETSPSIPLPFEELTRE